MQASALRCPAACPSITAIRLPRWKPSRPRPREARGGGEGGSREGEGGREGRGGERGNKPQTTNTKKEKESENKAERGRTKGAANTKHKNKPKTKKRAKQTDTPRKQRRQPQPNARKNKNKRTHKKGNQTFPQRHQRMHLRAASLTEGAGDPPRQPGSDQTPQEDCAPKDEWTSKRVPGGRPSRDGVS